MQTRTRWTSCFDMHRYASLMHRYAPSRAIYALKDIKPLYVLCGIFALAACAGERITVNPPPPPADWMVCEKLPAKPDLKPLVPFVLSDGRTVYLVDDVNARDSHIARYVLAVEGAWFDCHNQLGKVRGYFGEK